MPSIGELFIELGVAGDTAELEKLDKKLKEAAKEADNLVKSIQEEIEYNGKLEESNEKIAKLTDELAAAKTEEAAASIRSALAAAEAQKAKLEEAKAAKEAAAAAHKEVEENQKLIDKKKELAGNLGGVIKGIGGFIGAVAGAVVVLNKLTNDLVRTNQAMLDLTRTSDITLETFQKWGSIGKMFGVENAAQQLEGLNQRLFELMLTGEGARGFQLAGINPIGQDAEGVMEQLRARIQGMNDTTATYLLQQMGLDPRMLHLLRMGKEEFDALGKTIEKYQLTPDQTKEIQRLNAQLQIAGIKLQYLKNRAILALMPAFTKFMESITRVAELLARAGKRIADFVTKWRGLIMVGGAFLNRFAAVKTFFASMSATLKGISGVVGGLITKIPVLGGVFAKLGAIFARALLPLTALYLLLDDIAVFAQGGDSLIGHILNWAEEAGGDITKAFGKMFGGDFFGGAGDLFKSLIGILEQIAVSLEKLTDVIIGFSPRELGEKWGNNLAEWVKQQTGWQGFSKGEGNTKQQGAVTGGAAPAGYMGQLPNLTPNFVTPQMERNLSYNSVNTTNSDNRSINQNIQIQTTQPALDIQNQLTYARFAMNSAFA